MYAVYNVFNNEATIKDSLLSITPYVEKVIALDGPYKRFPHKTLFSTDKTYEILKAVCGKKLVWINFKKVWKSQVAKKNELLKHIPLGKWFFRIAADETLHGDVARNFKFAESSKFLCLGVHLKNFHPVWKGYEVRFTPRPLSHPYVHLDQPIPKAEWDKLKWTPYYGTSKRVIKKVEGTFFREHHSRLYITGKVLPPAKILKKIGIVNHPQKIGWKRWHQKIKYKEKRYLTKDWED